MRLRIWLDILTPKQLLFFKSMASKLEKRHTVLCTSRRYREVIGLSKIHKFHPILVGKHGGQKASSKLDAGITRMRLLSKMVQRFKPDVTISFCSPDAARVSFGLGVPHVGLSNAPFSDAAMRLTVPLLTKILIPRHIQKSRFTQYGISAKNIVQYKAMDEYLIIKNKPPSSKLPIKKTPGEKLVLFRTHESYASYAKKQIELAPMIKKISENPGYKVIVLGRYTDEIKRLRSSVGKRAVVLNDVVDSGQILSLCDVFVGSGGTMTVEAVLRGIPTISYNAVPHDDAKYLFKKGMIKQSTSSSEIVSYIEKFLRTDNRYIKQRAKRFVDSMEDPYLALSKTLHELKI